jgi:ubiquinone/menaquinone biosynthesis C-methylase UbiE
MREADEFSQISERRSKRIIPYVRRGKIVELGCGGGATLSILSKAFPRSVIVGVDHNMESLEDADRRKLENVIAIKGDVTQRMFPVSSFDTAIFKFSLHEVYSLQVMRVLKKLCVMQMKF